ncbi:MAG: beta-propeller domain-containing protein, partial [Thermoproteota archaeon]
MDHRRKAWLVVALAFFVLPASFAGSLVAKEILEIGRKEGIRRFESYQQLKLFLASRQNGVGWPYLTLDGSAWPSPTSSRNEVSSALALGSDFQAQADVRYSATNVQVEGVDEADIVKTDGKFAYVVSGGKVLLIRVYPPESMALLSAIVLEGEPKGMFVSGNRLVVLEQEFSALPIPYDMGGNALPEIAPWVGNVSLKVYDVSEKSDPRPIRKFSVNGFYSDSRMLGPYVYLVVTEPAVICEENVILPRIYECGTMKEVEASEIYYYESSEGCQAFNTVFALNVHDENAELNHETFLTASSDVVFMSLDNLYVAQTIWDLDGLIVPTRKEVTAIHKVRLEGLKIEYVAKGEVPGRVLNQFSMDEFEGFFRVATTTVEYGSGKFEESNNIYILDPEMNVVGSLEGLAPGERIHSARFMGDRCYVVTFKKVDPLFVLDLSSPTDPRVLGRLKIPGYSDYLHPFGSGFLIGVGKETVEAEEGDFAWYQGLKVSLFDVRVLGDPKEVSKLVIGDRGTDSPVLMDHKAFLLDAERGILVLPVLVAEIDPSDYPYGAPANAYGEYVWQGAYVLKVSTEEGVEVLGKIT